PRIIFKQPQKGVPLDPIQSIIVEVFDFDNDVDSVSFLYSTDNETWVLIDSRLKPEKGDIYRTMWVTEKIYNGEYYIKIIAKDKIGNQEEIIEGPFEVTMGKKKGGEAKEDFLASNLIWIIAIIIVIIIMILLIFLMLRRSKRREKELIEEVSTELRGERPSGEDELIPTTSIGDGSELGAKSVEADSIQTIVPASQAPALEKQEYEPEVETIEAYKTQMDNWKGEGYNVTRLEQLYSTDENMFARTFPIYSANISKLKNISTKLATMDTMGYETQVNAIKAKLLDPDQALNTEREFNDLENKLGAAPNDIGTTPELPAIDDMLPQLLPGSTTPDQEPFTDQPEAEMLPEIEIPPESEQTPEPLTLEHPEIPQSPFVEAETQTLEEELSREGPVAEVPIEPEVKPISEPEPEAQPTTKKEGKKDGEEEN
ncbi:MAG: hypothetical protein KAJ51_16160, partial [Thermoplasmata archaeon]|nr:hypothetical protein [Thermoplasmata archaeon]